MASPRARCRNSDPFEHWPLIRELRAFPLVGVAGTYFGLALLCGAWLRMRSTVDGQRPADLVRTLLCWAAPLALTAPDVQPRRVQLPRPG